MQQDCKSAPPSHVKSHLLLVFSLPLGKLPQALYHTFMATSAVSTSQPLCSVLGGKTYKITLVQPHKLFAVLVFLWLT